MVSVELRSDNALGIAPQILDAIAAANTGTALGYGGDETSARLDELASEVFEREARVFPVTTGTAANALGLSAMAPPWGAVLCHEDAHILTNEAAATSMFGAGLEMLGLPGAGGKVSAAVVREALEGTEWGDPHHSQPAVVSLTNVTEWGAVYAPSEIGEVAGVAREFGLRIHLDGARLANAVASAGCAPAQMVAEVDVLSLGATKNGAMSTDAIVSFDPAVSAELVYRTKRAGHTASKMRFQSVQVVRYLTDGLWLELAAHANTQLARLWAGLGGLGVVAAVEPEANLVFVDLPDGVADALEAAGVAFYRMGSAPGADGGGAGEGGPAGEGWPAGERVRLVTSFATTDDEVDHVLAVARDALG
ncbi:MAG TPA: low specificity L-threonine aldolase [Actinomycetales bacterium]|nr:low specificity L-threonine aldolase [Actinomycetales bacterium]